MGEIRHLPEAIHNSVRSDIILFDLTRVVEELIFNSLDAGATKIFIAVGAGTCYVKVMDNGCGISRDGLVLLAERYATSKFDQLGHENSITRTFGFRGEALSSIANVSLLEVLTKAHGRLNGYRKVMKGCKCLYFGIDDGRQDVGTTVIVRDLFYNQPVRRRHIQSSTKKVLQSIKKCVLRISLIHPKVSFNVVDIESDDELLCATSSSSPLSRLISGFGVEVANSLRELNATDGLIRLSGYISSPFHVSSLKAFQYIYINSRYICKGAIHKFLNQIGSSFNSLQHQKVNVGSQNAKRCRIQTCSTFILNLSCPRSWYDITFEPSKTSVEFKDWKSIFRFIEKSITRLWSEAFSIGDSLSDNTDFPADNMQTETGHTFSPGEGFSAKCGNPKRKGKVQNHAAAISFPSPSLGMQIEELDHSDYVIGNKFSCQNVPDPCDSSFKSFGEPLTQSKIAVDAEIGNSDSAADYHIFLTEDQFMANKFYNEHIDYLSSSSFHCRHRSVDTSMTNNFMKSDFPSDPFKICNINNVREDSEKPFLGRCTSQKRQVLDAESLTGSEGFDFPTESLRSKRSRHMLMELSSSSKNWVKPSLSGAYLDRDSNFLENSDSVFGTKIHGFEQHSDENLLRDHKSSAKYNYLEDHEIMDSDFVAWSTSSREDCFSASGVDIYSDFNNCALTDEGVSGFLQQNSQFDVPFPKSSDTFSDETKWLSTDLHGIHDDYCYATISHQIPSSIYLDDDKDQKVIKENCGMQRPRRSHSAPPVYRGKKKFLALNNHLPMEAEKIKYRHDYPGASELEHSKRSSGVCQLNFESNFTKDLVAQTRKVKEGPDIGSIEKVKMKEKLKGLHFNCTSLVEDIQNPVVSELKWQRGYPKTANGGKTHKLQNEDAILDLSSGLLHLAGDSLVPESTSKNLLEDAKVLQQVDKKFIPVVGHGVLAIIDQHAADERIRLEELREKVLSGDEKTITYLDTEKELVMPEIGYQLLHSYAELIQNWGWLYGSQSQSSRSFKKNLNILCKQPTSTKLIAVPCILGVNLTDVDLLEFLQQLADTDGSSVIPPSVHRVLNSKACRGAIMFGDSLLPSECSLIVEELNQTSLCFQCAHGRPTTVPLVNLEALHKQLEKLELWNGGSDTWHGLRRHIPSLERAKNRLGSLEVHC